MEFEIQVNYYLVEGVPERFWVEERIEVHAPRSSSYKVLATKAMTAQQDRDWAEQELRSFTDKYHLRSDDSKVHYIRDRLAWW